MDVSVIIVSYNSSAELRNCVASLRALAGAAGWELIVVDNASRPEELGALEGIGGIDLLIRNEVNLGFGAANNRGATRAAGDYLFFLNPDCLLLNNAIGEFLRFFRGPDSAGIGAAGCRLVDGEGRPNHYAGSFAGREAGAFLRSEFRQAIKPLVRRLGRAPRPARGGGGSGPPPAMEAVDWITGAALFMPAASFRAVGGFDEGIFLFSEEVDLQRRLAARGEGRVILSGPRVAHLHEKGRRMGQGTRLHFYRGFLTYLAKYNSAPLFGATRLAFGAIVALGALVHLVTREYRLREDLALLGLVAGFRPAGRRHSQPKDRP